MLLEKTKRIGTKILISGGGKCNITHAGPIEDVIRAFRPSEARFIRPSCYRFPNTRIVDMLVQRGLQVYTRPDGRIFPAEGDAKDVVRILLSFLTDVGVDLRLETPVSGLLAENGAITHVKVGSDRLRFDRVIVCTGGSSYPRSGTTGEGWIWAKHIGHRVETPMPALAPIDTHPEPTPGKPGVSLRSGELKARQNGKIFARWQGDTLFTHHGVSGPTALGISRDVAERLESGEVRLEIDLCQKTTFEALRHTIDEWIAANPRKRFSTLVETFVPQAICDDVVVQADVSPLATVSQVDRKSRNRLVETLKGLDLGKVATVPLEKGEVTAGGICLDEVDPQTMRSKLVEGLYLCGEVLDVAGPVGGYNLQAAFATGFVAGESAA